MSSHGYSYAEFADKYSQINMSSVKYLGFRDVPDLLRKYVQGQKALDFGCGHGKSTEFLKKLGFVVDGVDINKYMIDLARKALPECNFQVIQDGNIPAEDQVYDLVFASWVFHDINSKDKLVAALSEISRVLKPAGTFVLIGCSDAFYSRDWLEVSADFEENKSLKSGDIAKVLFKEGNYFVDSHVWTVNDCLDMLREVGLDVVVVHEPLGTDGEGIAWINEKEVAPYTVYVTKKAGRGAESGFKM